MNFVATRLKQLDASRIESAGDVERLEIDAPDVEAFKRACRNYRLIFHGAMGAGYPADFAVDVGGWKLPEKISEAAE